MSPLYFYTKNVVFQEVPNEVSLSFSIAGCNHNCKNCSWKNIDIKPRELTDSEYINLLNKYKGYVSCILFLGGEWNKDKLIYNLKLAKDYGFKTCLYTGNNDVDQDIKQYLDYLKVGPYIEERGGLDNPNTNQKFIDLHTNQILNKYFIKSEVI